jgi:protocatechuate 3,4-dioxygenase, alpha subunit
LGRTGTDLQIGIWAFRAATPGPVEGQLGHRPMPPHLNLCIAARGINLRLSMRMHFDDEEVANAADPVLNIIEQPERSRTLIARREMRDGRPVCLFDIRLQGEQETVFFEI